MPVIRVPIGSDGPVIDLDIWIGRAAAHALVAQGRAVPTPQTIRALIDTGADRTAIHPSALGLINSPPAGRPRFAGRAPRAPSGGSISTTYGSRSPVHRPR